MNKKQKTFKDHIKETIEDFKWAIKLTCITVGIMLVMSVITLMVISLSEI